MIVKSNTGIILKAGGLAVAWVMIVTYTTFPQLLENPICFLSEQINFENTGRNLLFGIGIYTFDMLAYILYSANKQIWRNILVAGILGCTILCVLIVPFAIGVEMNRIVPIIIIATAMGFLKGYNFYCNNEILQNDKIFQEGLL